MSLVKLGTGMDTVLWEPSWKVGGGDAHPARGGLHKGLIEEALRGRSTHLPRRRERRGIPGSLNVYAKAG